MEHDCPTTKVIIATAAGFHCSFDSNYARLVPSGDLPAKFITNQLRTWPPGMVNHHHRPASKLTPSSKRVRPLSDGVPNRQQNCHSIVVGTGLS